MTGTLHAVVCAVLACSAGAAMAQAKLPFAAGDPKLGMAMVEKSCQGCHIRQFGDADRVYLRRDHRVTTPAQLLTQVARCNTELGSAYSPEEEVHIAAYLNERYYKFKP
jgi:hypothetical protein